MSLIPCDSCAKRVQEKLSQVTWAWYRADGQRVAFRQRLCVTCYCTNLLPLDKEKDFDNLTCPACGVGTDRDMDPVYATAFVPSAGRQQFEFATCAPCAVEIRNRAQVGAQKLEGERSSREASGGLTTPTTRESYWSQIGIIPAEPGA